MINPPETKLRWRMAYLIELKEKVWPGDASVYCAGNEYQCNRSTYLHNVNNTTVKIGV